MKHRQNILTIVFIIICWFFVGCNSDAEREKDEPRLPETSTETPGTQVVKVTAQSISPNSVVDAQSTTSLTLNYSSAISISQINLITLNDRVITTATASGCTLVIPLNLEPLTQYSLKVSIGALSAGKDKTVNSFILKFSTRATVNINNVANNLCNNNASNEAKILYQYFHSIYGKNIISGVIENSYNRLDYSNLIYSATQQYPAIIEYEIRNIHTLDYNDISAIKNHHANGGIVSIFWQWVTPSLESDLPETYSVDSDFNIKYALRDDKWEFQFVENDLSIIAEILQKFKDEKIVVLFNPMRMVQNHWWGKLGATYFCELWKLVYDRLVVKYQLNNLIWVWSTEMENLTNEELKQWYPGDKYVDIIGTNIYSDNINSKIDRFLPLNETFEGKKMLAITECGNIPDISKCFDSGDSWLYFNSMYSMKSDGTLSFDSVYKFNTTSYWNTIINHKNVIAREEISIND